RESDWPMEITTPSEPKPRQPRPAKLTMRGEPVPERKPHQPPARKPLPKSGQPIVIGRDGKMKLPESSAPAQATPGRASGRPAPKASAHAAVGRPVQRINRSKGQNGKRG
ncbi:MAG: hypothetical protein SOY30_11660, partial [Eubacteriales bacterium]|nr:hypothetical protein [Eubacteriales bacterium]